MSAAASEGPDDYNGWRNRSTWDVALWLGNDEGLYRFAQGYRSRGYRALAEALREHSAGTGDGVAWDDPRLDVDALDELLREF